MNDADREQRRRHRGGASARADQSAEDKRRWDEIIASLGSIPDHGHEWDEDPAAWVRAQRRGDPRRVG
jgi:hypothetical protein